MYKLSVIVLHKTFYNFIYPVHHLIYHIWLLGCTRFSAIDIYNETRQLETAGNNIYRSDSITYTEMFLDCCYTTIIFTQISRLIATSQISVMSGNQLGAGKTDVAKINEEKLHITIKLKRKQILVTT